MNNNLGKLTRMGRGWMAALLCLGLAASLPGFAGDQPGLRLMPDPGGHLAIIRDIVFTPDGRYLVSASEDKTIRVWDLSLGKTVRMLRGQIGPGSEGNIFAMDLSPDGRRLAAGGYPSRWGIRLHDFHSGEILALLKGHDNVVNALAFSPDGHRLASGSADNTARIWDVANRRAVHTLRGHTDDIYAVAFTPDGLRMVTGSLDHTLRLWRVADGKLIRAMRGHTDKVDAVAVSRHGRIASGSWDHTIRLWDGKTGAFIKTLADQGTQIGSLSFSPDGRYLLSGVGDGPNNYCHLWSVPNGREILSYSEHDNIVLATAISPDGHRAATGGGNNKDIHLWDLRNGKQQQRLAGVGASVWAVGFAPDSSHLAWGKTKQQISPISRGPLKYQIRLPDDERGLGVPKFLEWNPGYIRARTAWRDWFLQHRKGGNYGYDDSILDIRRDGDTVASIERGSTDGYGHNAYTFTPDGRIVSGGGNGVLAMYNRQGRHLHEYKGHSGDVWAVAISPDGRLLASGSNDQTVCLWSLESGELLLTLFHSSDGGWMAWTPVGY